MAIDAIRYVEREIMYDCGMPGIPPQPMKVQILQYGKYEHTSYAGTKMIWYDVPIQQEKKDIDLAGDCR